MCNLKICLLFNATFNWGIERYIRSDEHTHTLARNQTLERLQKTKLLVAMSAGPGI